MFSTEQTPIPVRAHAHSCTDTHMNTQDSYTDTSTDTLPHVFPVLVTAKVPDRPSSPGPQSPTCLQLPLLLAWGKVSFPQQVCGVAAAAEWVAGAAVSVSRPQGQATSCHQAPRAKSAGHVVTGGRGRQEAGPQSGRCVHTWAPSRKSDSCQVFAVIQQRPVLLGP